MTNDQLRLRCLEMALEDISKKAERVATPFERAEHFFNYVKTGNPNQAPSTTPTKATVKRSTKKVG